MMKGLFITVLLSAATLQAAAQVSISGSIQSDILFPETDSKIGTEDYSEWALTNTYAEVALQSKHIDAGVRMEYTEHALPGFEDRFEGWGVGNAYLKVHYDKWDVTLGNVYEQFGSGFILRTYEERSLGVDNSILGARLSVKPFNGVAVKALSGKQRNYWSYNDAWISGADVELSIDRWIGAMEEANTYLTLGASWVNKYEESEDIMTDATHKLNLPTSVNAFDVRANLQTGGFNILGEYAWKTQDPSFDNGYIYRRGNVAMLSASYSKRGASILLQAKRSDNMSFRSKRSTTGLSSYINNLPAFTMEHTYALAALYPYATNADGEWAYQAEAGYRFAKGTALGGKYGTSIKVNFSHVHAIARDTKDGGGMGTDGYSSPFFKWGGETYYQDLNIQLEKKFTAAFKLNLMYMNQFYNKTAVEGEGGRIHSDIYIAEGKYRFNKTFTLRGELQYLETKDDEGDWMFGLLELSVAPGWMFTISDEYNSGVTDIHYYQGFITFNKSAHRLQLGYGRTRAGYNCSGGVCRYVPASKGFTLSYNYSF